jgi:hypothetical protein
MIMGPDGIRNQHCAGEGQQQFTRRSSQTFWIIYVSYPFFNTNARMCCGLLQLDDVTSNFRCIARQVSFSYFPVFVLLRLTVDITE